MKKVLIFGAGGMIGHQMYKTLNPMYDVFGTVNRSVSDYDQFNLFNPKNKIIQLDVSNFTDLNDVLNHIKPDVILNCIGITSRKKEIENIEYTKKLNTEFPHFLNHWCEQNNKHLIHFSTDCVFSGKSGPYTEDSKLDAVDLYGSSKAMGEVSGTNSLTLRGSMIGFELFAKTELLEWILSQKNQKIKGFSKAIYTGITTLEMSKLVANIVNQEKIFTGIYQVSSAPISKFDLVLKINEFFGFNILVEKDEIYTTEKILLCDKTMKDFGFRCPEWDVMLKELHEKYTLFSK